LLFCLCALLLGAAAIWLVQRDQGYILISLGSTTIEMSFWVGILIYLFSTLILIAALAILRWLLHAGGIRSWWSNRRRSRQMSRTAGGLMLFLSGDWQRSSKLLSQSAKNSEIPQVNWLYAAIAAGKNKDWETCKQFLEGLKLNYPETAVQADLTWVDFLLEDAKFHQALKILRNLNRVNPKNVEVIKSMSSVYRQQGDWSALSDLLPALRKLQVYDKKDLHLIEAEVYRGLLHAFSNNPLGADSEDQLKALWAKIPKQHRQQADIVIAYVDALVKLNDSTRAFTLLSKRLNAQWQDELVTAFGALAVKEPKKQLATAEKWLEQHPQSYRLLMALGRICVHMELFGKARDYLEEANRLQPSARTFFDLAAIYAELGDDQARLETYQKGLEFVVTNQ
jgi:HemY protein